MAQIKSKHQIYLQQLSEKYETAIAKNPDQENNLRDSYEIERLKYLGKMQLLSSIEVLFENQAGVLKRYQLNNQDNSGILNFRNNIFAAGIMIPRDPGTWDVYPPWAIKSITIHRQSKYFEP